MIKGLQGHRVKFHTFIALKLGDSSFDMFEVISVRLEHPIDQWLIVLSLASI